MKPKLLDLFSGAGGCAAGYAEAGFDVYGIDISPQPNYPYPHQTADAIASLWRLIDGEEVGFASANSDAPHALDLKEFDAIHASPPCQSYLNLGAVNRAQGRAYDHASLIGATREALIASGKPYVIENVQDAGKEPINPVRVCGTYFNLPLRRHRLFESNTSIAGTECRHDRFTEPKYWTGWRPRGEKRLSTVVQIYGNAGGREHWPAAMGIDWMTPREMCEAVPPAYMEHIGRQLIAPWIAA